MPIDATQFALAHIPRKLVPLMVVGPIFTGHIESSMINLDEL